MVDCIEKFPCRKCGKTFSAKFAQKKHETFCGIENTREPCEKCQRFYKNLHSLRTHRTRCNGKAQFKTIQCSICGISYKQASSFHQHMRICHGDAPLPPFIPYSIVRNVQKAEIIELNKSSGRLHTLGRDKETHKNWHEPICKLEFSNEEPAIQSELILPDDGNTDETNNSPDMRSMYFQYDSSSEEETESFLMDYRVS